jgi:SAM-dependent methyltransferase
VAEVPSRAAGSVRQRRDGDTDRDPQVEAELVQRLRCRPLRDNSSFEQRGVGPAEVYGRGLLRGDEVVARDLDGTVRRLPLEEWKATRLPGDGGLVDRCSGAVLDVGCGPGRLTVAVGATGLSALGLDVSSAAVALARARGAEVLHRSVFRRLPRTGCWTSVLLADGNVGIGGDPLGLLTRIRQLLCSDGQVLVEVRPPGTSSRRTTVRLESGSRVSAWFPWAELGSDDVAMVASSCSLHVEDRWVEHGRHFVALAAA